MDAETLLRLQQTEKEILNDVATFCDEHNIVYSLAEGTALGAVRHRDFIPWDDDIDIMMDRNNYEKFQSEWRKENNAKYFLQGTDGLSRTSINHIKVRLKGTAFISESGDEKVENNGIWIDIFAYDKVPNNNRIAKKMRFYGKLRLIYTRNKAIRRLGFWYFMISSLMLCVPKKIKKRILIKCDKEIVKYKDLKENFFYITFVAVDSVKNNHFNSDLFLNTQKIDFGIYKFMITSQYEKYLTALYGNYMKYPPLSEQKCTHNPIKIQFKNN